MNLPRQISQILSYFRKPDESAKCAKERLQIIIAHERGERDKPDYLPMLQKDIFDVVIKYVKINKEDIKIQFDHQDRCSILELNVILPASASEATTGIKL